MEPKIINYLDSHLDKIVEDIVREEIQKIVKSTNND